MKISKQKLISLAICLLGLAGCAEERPLEPVYDFDDNRYEKSTLLSSDNWMYKATVTKTSSEGGFAFAGISTQLMLGRFEFGRDRLSFYNNVTPYASGNEENLPELINSWEITHSKYRLAESDGKVLNSEQEDNRVDWQQKPFFKIKWASQKIDMLGDGSPCFELIDQQFVENSQEVTNDHFSFTTEHTYELKLACNSYANIRRRINSGNFTYTIQVKHSFAPMKDSDYKPLVYTSEFDERKKAYGFFETVIDRFNEDKGRFEKVIVANRWHPEKTHTFYFAEDFPAEYKWIYNHPEIGVEKRTNDLFEKNGLAMRVRFVDDPAVKFGDVRYSFVKFVEKSDDSAPLGYGPSDVNPLTGEIIRSDSLVWTSSLKEYVRRIRDYEIDEPSLDDSIVFEQMGTILADAAPEVFPRDSDPQADWLSTAHVFDSRQMNFSADEIAQSVMDTDRNLYRRELQKVIAGNLYSNPAYGSFTAKNPNSAVDGGIGSLPQDGQASVQRLRNLLEKTGQSVNPSLDKTLEAIQHSVEHFSSKGDLERDTGMLRVGVKDPTTVHDIDQYLEMIPGLLGSKTDQQIIDSILYFVAIHEFGHNLNLRHNFYGSVDYLNFEESRPQVDRNNQPILSEDGKPLYSKPMTASVMDYLTLSDEYNNNFTWGPYDQAALVFAYSNGEIDLSKVEVKVEEGKVKLVDRKTSTPFLFCTDEHRLWSNPFCNAFDSGTTPSEVVMSMIKSYVRSYKVRNTPYLRPYWDTRSYDSAVFASMFNPLKFLALYDDRYSWFSKLSTSEEFGDVIEGNRVLRSIEKDMRRAVSLLGVFYASIKTFKDTDRAYLDNVDAFSGEILRKGIFPDKIAALYALSGTMRMSISNQGEASDVSFLNFLNDDTELGSIAKKTLLDVAVEDISIPFKGYESFGRSLFVSSAIANGSILDEEYIDRMAVQCYSGAALQKVFGIDVNDFYTVFNEQSQDYPVFQTKDEVPLEYRLPLTAGFVRLGGVEAPRYGENRYPVYEPTLFPAGADGASVLAVVVKVGEYYYLASQLGEKKRYSFEYLSDVVNDGSSLSGTQYVVYSKALYDFARFGFIQDCVDAN